MYIEPKIIEKYGRIINLEMGTTDEGEKVAAANARKKFEEKYPGIEEAFEAFLDRQRVADEAIEQGFADPNEDQGSSFRWERFAEMAGDFFSHMKDYTEFAFGIGYARKLARKCIMNCRDNATGSMSINFRIKAEDLDTLEMMTDEQKKAFIASVADDFEALLKQYVEDNL